MLISSAIISLKACLPVFWFISFVYILRPPGSGFKRLFVLSSTIILALVGSNMTHIVTLLPLDSLEWFYSFSVILALLASFRYFAHPNHRVNQRTLGVIVLASVLVHLPQSMSLGLYVLTNSLAPKTSMASLMTGLSLGALVSLALAVCWYLLAVYVLSSRYLVWVMLCLFSAGRVLLIEQWIAQIGWLTWVEPMLDMNQWFNETSVFGVLIHTLLGINATLSAVGLSVYLLVLVLGGVWLWHQTRPLRN